MSSKMAFVMQDKVKERESKLTDTSIQIMHLGLIALEQ